MRSCAVTLSRTELATISRSARRITEEVLAPVEIVRSEIRDGFRTLASSRNLTYDGVVAPSKPPRQTVRLFLR
jgi:hypothetical protein